MLRPGTVLLILLSLPLAATEAWVWIEGEAAISSNFKPHNWYSDQVKQDLLSDGKWLTTFDGPANATASWTVELPSDGLWTLWLRANPIQAGLDWRLDAGAWQTVAVDQAQDSLNLASDGKPDLRFVAWMKCGSAEVKAGQHLLEVRTTATLNHHAGIDALLFTSKPFVPNGKTKPGTVLTEAEPGWFAFAPDADAFLATAQLDLRGLNEKRAGDAGWLRAQGDDLVMGDGTPVRLWSANAASHEGPEAAHYLMARLAKTGVNCVRLHGLIADREGGDPLVLSRRALSQLHDNIAAAANQGIYVHLSTYFPLWLRLKPNDGIADAAIGKHPFGLLLFEPRFQTMYKAWTKAVLTGINPHTGRTVAEDPAVAFWEIQNEDSFLFWTMSKENLGAGPWRTLCGFFAEWAIARHGSVDKAIAAWGGDRHADDDLAGQRLGLHIPWETTREVYAKAAPGRQARIADQVRFYAERMRATYTELAAFVRKECGFKGIITASNWTTADNRQLAGIERWTYAATDAVDRHAYFGGKHEGEAAGWSVRTGHTYSDRAAVLDPAGTPLGYLQLVGRPHLISEIAWNKPNRFSADGMLLLASYGALQGVDGIFTFAASRGAWAGDGSGKWPLMMPSALGQFPAAALQYRRGDLTPGPVAVRQVVTVDDLFRFRGSGLIEGQNADFRLSETPRAAEVAADSGFDPLIYFTGRVERVITGLPGTPPAAKPLATDLTKAIDRSAKVVTSLTGELRWDWGRGLVTVNSPRSQAATGFLAQAGELCLGAVTIRSASEYGTVQVISLDGAPLASAKRMLIQAFTEERMYAWRSRDGRIEDTGRAPINVREIDASVTFANGVGLTATALDGHGYSVAAVAVAGGTITLPRDRLYVLVTR